MDSRSFAVEVVKQLQAAGYQALWAGGCVRDQLMGRVPKDYDVATEATPEQIQQVFRDRRTLSIGAAFGVITVVGPKQADPIEIATFRRDLGYSDGRRPDAVAYTNAKEDALRRDFTINGMFYDPIHDQVLDFVGGQEDLQQQCIRAIGQPDQRIEEDKLRMLRAVRFASTYRFSIEPKTLSAIQANASRIDVVSGERIGAELRRMLAHPNRAVAAALLAQSDLLPQIVDQADAVLDPRSWQQRLAALERLNQVVEQGDRFSQAVSILLAPILNAGSIEQLFERWKLNNEERKSLAWTAKQQQRLAGAKQRPWSEVQPLLMNSNTIDTLAVMEASQSDLAAIQFCRERLQWPAEKLNPTPLIGGQALIEAGIQPGPLFKQILAACRASQLDGEIATSSEAMSLAKQLYAADSAG